MHGSYIDTREADPVLMEWFIRQLVLKSAGKTYGRAFRRIAKEIAEAMGASVVDRLAELVREVKKPRPVKLGKTHRDKAIDRIAKRKKRGRLG